MVENWEKQCLLDHTILDGNDFSAPLLNPEDNVTITNLSYDMI